MAAASLNRSGRTPRRTLPIVAGVVVLLAAVLVAGTYLYDRSQRDVIANGVRIDGVAVGGLDAAEASRKVEGQLGRRLGQPVTVSLSSRRWTLQPTEAGVRVNVANMVDQAETASHEGSLFTRTVRNVFGGSLNRDIPLVIAYSHEAVRRLAVEVQAAVDRPPRDATVEPSGEGLRAVPSQVGLQVDYSTLGERIDRTLVGLTAGRSIHVPTHAIEPAVTSANLAAHYPAYIVVDRGAFTLRFYNHLKLERTFEIAVGMEGLETPAGLHKIEWEEENPPWYVPKKAWAGALAGTVVPPGPADPLKARFMSFDGGAGIHGIDPSEYSSIGHDASHGCVRMRIPDVIALYSRTPVGTPVYIV